MAKHTKVLKLDCETPEDEEDLLKARIETCLKATTIAALLKSGTTNSRLIKTHKVAEKFESLLNGPRICEDEDAAAAVVAASLLGKVQVEVYGKSLVLFY